MTVLTPQDALVAVMVTTSAADQRLSTPELLSIERIVSAMPAFEGYDPDRVAMVSRMVMDMLSEEDGLDAILGLVREALPDELGETAYAMACDVAAADGRVKMTELRFLEMVRHELNVGRLAAAAIERGARARHMRIPRAD
ncbi:tellurite resistance TerB family protein [Oceanicella actignis]|uniref:Tellurite resistance protein n=1 Tax=Oceanicella actignis TaxID=1189325 RepID=A0A1M7RSR5_9RHOB|nr:tellurite resistance TerB family protein [Oceanicella actignis]TYO89489.1 tellurite resistance protein [Oceanicella actignis]SET05571.1 Tellurite resistance protein [Oceanicella actignis]SHN49220.1 Tellurite resistance protein [Oceanicella actignis]